jgi:hypothetical protein
MSVILHSLSLASPGPVKIISLLGKKTMQWNSVESPSGQTQRPTWSIIITPMRCTVVVHV